MERDFDANGGYVEYEQECSIDLGDGEETFVPLKLNLTCMGSLVESWSASLKLHSKRIDGIDWHPRYFDRYGVERNGWHRHDFDAVNLDDKLRVPVDGFDGIDSRRQFLGHALRTIGVVWNGVDHGTDELPFD